MTSRPMVTIAQQLLSVWFRALAQLLPRVVVGRHRVERLSERGAPFAYACLHGDSVLLLSTHLQEPLALLVSQSEDGVLAAGLLRRLGFSVAHGSTSANASSGLRRLCRLSESGRQAVITVDGPRGPAGEVAAGIIALAQLRDLWIVPVAASCRNGVRLASWDRARLPMPWSQTVVAYGRPFRVARGADRAHHRGLLKDQLRSLSTRVDRLCGRSVTRRPSSTSAAP